MGPKKDNMNQIKTESISQKDMKDVVSSCEEMVAALYIFPGERLAGFLIIYDSHKRLGVMIMLYCLHLEFKHKKKKCVEVPT
jgi:hypothetical protein